jgi:hypothetical protein
MLSRRRACSLREVVQCLVDGLGLRVVEEAVLGGGAISVDALIMPPDGSGLAPIAVEVDGPWHFFSNLKQEPTGTTAFKRRLLDLAVQRGEVGGWVSVPYWEWILRKTMRLRQELLQHLLEAEMVEIGLYR